jgi:hypothetical protein
LANKQRNIAYADPPPTVEGTKLKLCSLRNQFLKIHKMIITHTYAELPGYLTLFTEIARVTSGTGAIALGYK